MDMPTPSTSTNENTFDVTQRLENVVTGESIRLHNNRELAVGKFEVLAKDGNNFISKSHSVVRNQYNQYYIYNKDSTINTFKNNEELPSGMKNFKLLKKGDKIMFGDNTEYKLLESFALNNSVTSNDNGGKVFHSVIKIRDGLNEMLTNLSIIKDPSFYFGDTHSTIDEKIYLQDSIKTFVNALGNQKAMVQELTKIDKENKERIFELNGPIKANLLKSYEKQKSELTLRNNNEIQELESNSKMTMINLLQNHNRCTICKNVFIKAHSVTCGHTFCECCIFGKLEFSSLCPICHLTITSVNSCRVMDDLITNMYNEIGGDEKEKRHNVILSRGNCNGCRSKWKPVKEVTMRVISIPNSPNVIVTTQ